MDSNLPKVASHSSPSLSELITIMLKESDNIIANSLFKKIAAISTHAPGTWNKGSIAIKKLLHDKFNIQDITIADGSGASRYNLVTPLQLQSLLNYIYIHGEYKSIILPALPIAGYDGTLKGRLKESTIQISAKTGSESGISSLAGYIKTKTNKTLSFVIMINNGTKDIAEYKKLENQICLLIYRYF